MCGIYNGGDGHRLPPTFSQYYSHRPIYESYTDIYIYIYVWYMYMLYSTIVLYSTI